MKSILITLVLGGVAYCQHVSVGNGEIEDTHVSIQFRVLPGASFYMPQMQEVARRFLETTGSTHAAAALIAYDSLALATGEGVSCEGSGRLRIYAKPLYPAGSPGSAIGGVVRMALRVSAAGDVTGRGWWAASPRRSLLLPRRGSHLQSNGAHPPSIRLRF